MQMIGRVARAILSKVPSGYGMTEAESIDYAKAAIEAMREPTEEMVEAGGTANYGHPREDAVEWAKEEKWDAAAHEAVFLYTAMIDAALQESKETENV